MNAIIPFILILQTSMSAIDRRVITTLKYSRYRVKPTIVNGEAVENTRVPYMVSIKEQHHKINDEFTMWSNLCGGSILTTRKVLTAAHCFDGSDFYYAKRPNLLRIVAGSTATEFIHSGKTKGTMYPQVRQIENLVLHGDFLFPVNDLALIFVDDDWVFNTAVDYIKPASRSIDYPKTCVAAGYGKVGFNVSHIESPVLLMAPITVMTKWQCSVLWEINMNTFICTDAQYGDVARGDSGGPLSCYGTADPEESPGKEILVGVVSGKNFDKTTLFTRVSAYHDWIDSNLGCKSGPSLSVIIFLLLIYLLFI